MLGMAASTSSTPRPRPRCPTRRTPSRAVIGRYRDGVPRGARPLPGAARRARRARAPAAPRAGRRRGRRGVGPSAVEAAEAGADDARLRDPRARTSSGSRPTSAGTSRSSPGSSSPIAEPREHAGSSSSAATRAWSRATASPAGPTTSRCGSSRPRRPSGPGSPRRSTTDRPRRCRTRSSRSSTSSGSWTATRGWPGPSFGSCASCSGASSATSARFISQLRPPLLDELGLDGSINDTVETMAALTGLPIETDLEAAGHPAGRCPADGGPAGRPGSAPERAQARQRPSAATIATRIEDDALGRSRSATTVVGFDVGDGRRPAADATSVCSSCVSAPS